MRDELQVIDVVERLKGHLLAERPQLGELIARRLSDFAADHPIQYYKERFLAALTLSDVRSPSTLRELSRAVWRSETEPEAFQRELVAEEPAPFYTRLATGKRRVLLDWLKGLDGCGEDARSAGVAWGSALRSSERLDDALKLLRATFKGLPALDQYRVLKAWDYPVVLPSARRQTFFYRLGLLQTRSSTAKALRHVADVGEGIGRIGHEPLQSLDLLIGIFVADEPGQPVELGRCAQNPVCENCCVASHCDFVRFQRKDDERKTTIKDWDVKQRPRERLARLGAPQLGDAELLAILLRTGTSRATAMELAHQILRRFDGLRGMDDAALAELCHEKGIGSVKAITLKAAFELGKRLAGDMGDPGEYVHSSFDVFLRYHHRMANLKQEQFHLLCMDMKHRITHESMVSKGSLASSLVHPREAYKEAIRNSAASVIFFHNHPSGDPTPSNQDEEVTARLKEAGKLLGIPMLDHVIIGNGRYYSWEAGRTIDLADDEEEDLDGE